MIYFLGGGADMALENVKGAGLPIAGFKGEILDAVKANPVVIITAETGAGKSTQVPKFLLEAGYDLVVTQPRRLAARTVAQRVAEELGEKLGEAIGFRTAVDRADSAATRCLFCTDGLALVRELMGQNKGVLVLDEVHEWNENMEVLVAWTKILVKENPNFKVVLMSATLEAEKLAAFYEGAPVISVPGRTFQVTEEQPTKLVDDVVRLVNEDRNVLVFQPGKQEIEETVATLRQLQVSAEILPLHGQLTPAEQAKCFKHYSRPKVVVSTNVAQTSVTIDDIDAVVDSGTERRIELVNGVEGLYLKPISRADAAQRKGRAGRTKAGIYIDHCPSSDRADFPKAEILRKRLDQTVLRLAIAGFDMAELEFFHQPAKSEIANAKRSLVALGCMDAAGAVTKIGKLVNRLPVSVQYARMLVEANERGVVEDVLTIAAILEVGGITVAPPSRNQPDRPDWRRMVPTEKESDVMGQLAVYKMAKSMTKDDMYKKGVLSRNYFRAKEIRSSLVGAVRRFFDLSTTGCREDILKSVCAGMVDHLYEGSYGTYRNGDNIDRQLGTASLVSGASWLVGKPFDLQIKTRRGEMTLRLIEMASKVDPAWMAEIAPHLVETQTGLNPAYCQAQDCVVSTTKVLFNGRVVREEQVADGNHPDAARVFAGWLVVRQSWIDFQEGFVLSDVFRANTEYRRQAEDLNRRVGDKMFRDFSSFEEREEFFLERLAGARSVGEIVDPQALLMTGIDEELAELVLSENPDSISLCGEILEVKYKSFCGRILADPRVTLSQNIVASNRWLDLPDEGVNLPGGRKVEVVAGFTYHDFSSTNIPELKEKVLSRLNKQQWDDWDRLAIEVPDSSDPNSEVPLVSAVYGQCVVSGDELVGYGTFEAYQCWSSDPITWRAKWFQSHEEAQQVQAKATQKLEEVRAREAQQRELAGAQASAEDVQKKLKELKLQSGYSNLSEGLKKSVEEKVGYYTYLPRDLEGLRNWTADAEEIASKAEAELSKTTRPEYRGKKDSGRPAEDAGAPTLENLMAKFNRR